MIFLLTSITNKTKIVAKKKFSRKTQNIIINVKSYFSTISWGVDVVFALICCQDIAIWKCSNFDLKMLKSEKIILTKHEIYVFSETRYKIYTPCKIFPLTLINLTYIKKSTKYTVRLEHSIMLTLFKKKIKSTGYESKNDTLTIFVKSSIRRALTYPKSWGTGSKPPKDP